MGYIPGKRLYHASEMNWPEEDWAACEADMAYEYSRKPLKDRVFHEWSERKQLNDWRAIYLKGAMDRYGGKCVACGTTEHLNLDHKTPVSKGGTTCGENLQLLCRSCNSRKHDMLYYEWLFKLRAGELT